MVDVESVKEAIARFCARIGGEVDVTESRFGTTITCRLRKPVKIPKITKMGDEVAIEIEKGMIESDIFKIPATNLTIHSKPAMNYVGVDIFGEATSIYDILAESYIEARIRGDDVRLVIV